MTKWSRITANCDNKWSKLNWNARSCRWKSKVRLKKPRTSLIILACNKAKWKRKIS